MESLNFVLIAVKLFIAKLVLTAVQLLAVDNSIDNITALLKFKICSHCWVAKLVLTAAKLLAVESSNSLLTAVKLVTAVK